MCKMFKRCVTMLGEEMLTCRWILFGVILYVFGSRSKEQLYDLSNQTKQAVNQWDLINSMVGNIYLIIYVVLLVLLWRSLSIILGDFEYTVLIRSGSYRNWIYRTLVQLLQTIIVMTFVWISVILLKLVGVPFSNGWSSFSELNQSFSESQILEKYIGSPAFALLLHVLLFWQSVIVIHLFLAILYVVTKKKMIVILTAVFIWLYGAASFRFLPEQAYVLNLSNYMLLHWGAASFDNIWVPFAAGFGTLFLLIFVLNRIDLSRENLKKLSPNFVYCLFIIIIFLVFWSETKPKIAVTIWDQFLIHFLGGSQAHFNLKAFLSYFIMYFGFLFFIQLSLQRELYNTGYYKLFRFQSVNKWFWNWFKRIPVFCFLYLVFLAILSFAISSISGFSFSFQLTLSESVSINEVIYHFFMNGFLQLLFYALFIFAIAWISKEVLYSFIGTSILSIFMFPGLNPLYIIPSGLNSMSYILGNHSVYIFSIILSIWILVSILFILFFFQKKDIDFS